MAYAPKKPETSKNKRGRIPGGGDTVARPGKRSGGGKDTSPGNQNPQPAAQQQQDTTPGSPDNNKQDFGPTRAPRGPQRAGESKKKGRIPGGGDTVYRPGKKKKSGGTEIKYAQRINKYNMGS
jgi:hypothetical protein